MSISHLQPALEEKQSLFDSIVLENSLPSAVSGIINLWSLDRSVGVATLDRSNGDVAIAQAAIAQRPSRLAWATAPCSNRPMFVELDTRRIDDGLAKSALAQI